MSVTNSSSLTTIGGQSKTTYLNNEAHKLSLEFIALGTLYAGQPLKLDAATGKVTPWVKTDSITLLIGYAHRDALVDDVVTIYVKGSLVIWALSVGATLNAGPVVQSGYDTSTDLGGNRKGYNQYETPGSNPPNGWSLDYAGAAGTLIRVLLSQ